MRLTAAGLLSRASYPINFVVKHPNLHVEGPALGRLKPAGLTPACFLIGVTPGGDDQETAYEFLVELTGIEPVTPCLQSRCSPS